MLAHYYSARPRAVFRMAIIAGTLSLSGASLPAAETPPVNTVVATISGFNSPLGLAISRDSSKVYVANEGASDTVSVIDTSSNQITSTLMDGGERAWNLALTSTGQELFVTNANNVGWQYDYGTITIINTETGTSTNVVTNGPQPKGLTLTPDGKTLWIADQNSTGAFPSRIDFLDVATGTMSPYPVTSFGYPECIVFTPNGKKAYIATLDGIVEIFDVATRTRESNYIEVGDDPWGMCMSPRGNTAYVLNSGLLAGDPSVSVIDLTKNKVTATIDLTTTGSQEAGFRPALTPDGKYLYVPLVDISSVVMISTATNSIVGDPIPAGNSPRCVAIAPNGRYAYVTNEGDGTVTVIGISK